jgi:glycosyltransferase involved in cell wall biosynthesis
MHMPRTGATGHRPRVCFVVESGTDVRLADGLAELSDLTILARTIPGGVAISQPPGCAINVVHGPSGIGAFARTVFRFLRTSPPGRFDFILVQGYGAAAAAANLGARWTRVPTAMLVCSPVEAYYRCRRTAGASDKPFRRHELAALQLFARMNARLGSRYIVLSEHLRDVVRSHGATGAVDVIPLYGVDTSVFRPSSLPRAELRQRRGLPEDAAVVFFSSRVAPEKDTATVLDAIAMLNQRGRRVFLLHRSGGFEQFRAEASTRRIGAQVIATDAVHPHNELPLDYAASDVCVQSSHEEGLGFSVLEALACEVPVVATHVGGLRETIVEGKTGWSCPPRNVEAMADAIADALDRPDEAHRRATAGRRMVEQRFDRGRVFGHLRSLIASAAMVESAS